MVVVWISEFSQLRVEDGDGAQYALTCRAKGIGRSDVVVGQQLPPRCRGSLDQMECVVVPPVVATPMAPRHLQRSSHYQLR